MSKSIHFLGSLGLLLALAGCGGGGGAGAPAGAVDSKVDAKGSQAVGITGGTVVDPYIVGATFFEDANNNGRWEPGEQISTASDEEGRFFFASSVAADSGHSLIMFDQGTHLGLPFTGKLLLRPAPDAPAQVVVSPLTTLLGLGLSPAEIVELLRPLQEGQEVGGYDFAKNPLAGLEEVADDRGLAELRANLYLGAVLDLYFTNREPNSVSRQELLDFLQNWEPLAALMEGLRYAVRTERLAGMAPPDQPGLPRITMREVAEAVGPVLEWWKQEVVQRKLDGRSMVTSAELQSLVDTVLPGLALRAYVRCNSDLPAVQQAMQAGRLPRAAAGAYASLRPDGTVAEPQQGLFDRPLVAGQTFAIGREGRIAFLDDSDGSSGTVEFTPANGETLYGIWRLQEGELVIQGDDPGEPLRLDFVSKWPNHLLARAAKEEAPYASPFLQALLQEAGEFEFK